VSPATASGGCFGRVRSRAGRRGLPPDGHWCGSGPALLGSCRHLVGRRSWRRRRPGEDDPQRRQASTPRRSSVDGLQDSRPRGLRQRDWAQRFVISAVWAAPRTWSRPQASRAADPTQASGPCRPARRHRPLRPARATCCESRFGNARLARSRSRSGREAAGMVGLGVSVLGIYA
jgi:hypothetical protein